MLCQKLIRVIACLLLMKLAGSSVPSSANNEMILLPKSKHSDHHKSVEGSKGPGQLKEPETRAMWLSFPWWDMTLQNKRRVAKYLADYGINKVFLSVYDSGIARWNSKTLSRAGLALPMTDRELMESVNLFRNNGIRVAAFFEGGLSVFLERDFVRNRPDLLQSCNGGVASGEHGGHLMAFLDPSLLEARQLVVDTVAELAKHPAHFDEIQLDRFRYTHWDWKLCTARDGTANPEHVNTLVQEIYFNVKRIRSTIRVSASPVGSYGFWKLNQRWGDWVRGGYIDAIDTQAYIPMDDLSQCVAGSPVTHDRQVNLAIFKGEFASFTGQPQLLEDAVDELRSLGADADAILELSDRRPMVRAREQELAEAPRRVPISVGFMAHQYDDSQCVLEQMKLARRYGLNDAVLWVSGVAPRSDGSPNPEIHDNLSLLKKTLWRRK